MLSDEWLPRYRLLENFTAKWNGNGNGNGNGNAYDRGDYNSSFALRAVELKSSIIYMYTTILQTEVKFLQNGSQLLRFGQTRLSKSIHRSYLLHIGKEEIVNY